MSAAKNLDLEAIKARYKVATPGPWRLLMGRGVVQTSHVTRDVWDIPRNAGDAEFIAHARQDIPELVEVLEAALKVLHAYGLDTGLGYRTHGQFEDAYRIKTGDETPSDSLHDLVAEDISSFDNGEFYK